jgi:hypothetical protein
MLSVLEKAVEDLNAPRPGGGPIARARIRREAEAWFLSEDESYLFSFINICQAFDLDAGAIRRALLAPHLEVA